MDDHPKMLYRFPSKGENSILLEGATYDTRVVGDADAEAAAVGDGWCATWPEANANHAANMSAMQAAQAAADAAAAPNRAELEQKATELGIKFDGRTSDKKLSDLIAATLEP